ncbi:MAG: hypothetical protein IOD12_07215 [Silvanigrellales bacterium]|jgi:hypothetical protein|nr:hypothetical protein [Silvanigrellales bacterium]
MVRQGAGTCVPSIDPGDVPAVDEDSVVGAVPLPSVQLEVPGSVEVPVDGLVELPVEPEIPAPVVIPEDVVVPVPDVSPGIALPGSRVATGSATVSASVVGELDEVVDVDVFEVCELHDHTVGEGEGGGFLEASPPALSAASQAENKANARSDVAPHVQCARARYEPRIVMFPPSRSQHVPRFLP